MKIRIIKQVPNGFREEIIYISEIIETQEKFIFKKFLDDEIFEIEKLDLFYYEFLGTFIKIKKGDQN